MRVIGIIPARYDSSRFKGKPLADLWGRPMIWWVYHQVRKARRLQEVWEAITKISPKRMEPIGPYSQATRFVKTPAPLVAPGKVPPLTAPIWARIL